MVLSDPKIKSSRQLINQFKRQNNFCQKLSGLLLVSTQNVDVIKNLDLPRRPPLLLHVVHGLYIIYDANLADMSSIFDWINFEIPANLKVVGESHLKRVFSREETVVVIFMDESTPHLNAALKKVSIKIKNLIDVRIHLVLTVFLTYFFKAIRELELAFGLAAVDVSDVQVASEYNVTNFPSVILYERGHSSVYPKDLKVCFKNGCISGLYSIFWTKNGPKRDQKGIKNGPKGTKIGPKVEQKWTKNGQKMDLKWT